MTPHPLGIQVVFQHPDRSYDLLNISRVDLMYILGLQLLWTVYNQYINAVLDSSLKEIQYQNQHIHVQSFDYAVQQFT